MSIRSARVLGAERVTIVGGTGAVSEAVAARLAAGGRNVDRLSGQTRFETAVLAAQAAVAEGGDDTVVFVARDVPSPTPSRPALPPTDSGEYCC